MPTTIDSLVVELALDARNLNEQTRQALDQFRRTGDEAKKHATEAEGYAKKQLEFFSDLKRVAVGMTTLFLGGMGIKEFTGFLVNLDSATGRVAKTMDVTAQELSTWQGAAERMGNTSEGITGTLQGLSSELNKFSVTGQTSLLGPLTQLGISLYNTNGQLKTSTQLFQDITKAIEGMDPARARAIMTMLGFDQGAINMAIEGQNKLADALQKAVKAGVPSDEDIKKMQESQAAIAGMERSATGLGRAIVSWAAPGISATLDAFSRLFNAMRSGKKEDGTPAATGNLSTYGLGGFNWSSPTFEGFMNRGGAPPRPAATIPAPAAPRTGRLIGDTTGMNPDFVQRLRDMAATYGDINLNSGFRTAAQQARLRRHNPSGYPVARGMSAHERGLAADIRGATPEIDQAIHAHANEYGIQFPVPNDPVHAVPFGPTPPIGAAAGVPQQTSMNGHTDRSTKIDIAQFNINANNAKDVQRVVDDIPTTVRRAASIASYGSGLA